ncbi:ABC transporter permease [Aequorivita marisscotiae]|uniref:ABC transporter permease subunit n=1 Tax=Aequorivita marisscotiae TaxID=3040348 RepID=A0ABY8KSA1_9FLAO|nr:ABC transporter permease subunit [Aequorivita sp. Ant34-E75]WGF91419.1 ABC transporter permease subunit [Aequorivita sp. Ant34-E75]
MRQLVYLEIYKLCKQSRTYYAILALLFIETVVLVSGYYQGAEILDIVLANLKDTFYFEGNLLNGNLIIYFILNSFWFHVPLLCMIIVSGLFTTEYEDKTLQTVLMQPVVKWKYLLAKYITAILFTVVLVLFLAATSFVFSYAIFGTGDLVVYSDGLTFFEQDEAFLRLCYAFLIGTLSLVFFSVVSLTLAVLFKESFKTLIVAALFLIISTLLLKIDLPNDFLNQIAYFKLNNTWQNFFTFTIDWQVILVNTSLLLVYTLVTVGIGLFVFQKNDTA